VVLDGDWKLQQLELPHQRLLYNLKDDPTERRDLATREPAKVVALTALLAQHDNEQMNPSWPALIHSPIAIDRPLGTKPVPGEAYVYWSN